MEKAQHNHQIVKILHKQTVLNDKSEIEVDYFFDFKIYARFFKYLKIISLRHVLT